MFTFLLRLLSIFAIMGIAAGCSLTTGASSKCIGVNFEARPTYLCPGENVTLAWNVLPERIPCSEVFDLGFGEGCLGSLDGAVSVFLSSEPTNLFEPPGPLPNVGTTSVIPPRDSEITLTAIRQIPDRKTETCNIRKNEFVILRTETRTHVEVFEWGCKSARDGGVGWSSVDYDLGEISSSTIAIRGVRNTNPFSIIVGMRRDRPDGTIQIETARLGPGETSDDRFNGPFFGVWEASHAEPGSFGPDGCDIMKEPGDILWLPGEREPLIISPRPDIRLEFTLICTAP